MKSNRSAIWSLKDWIKLILVIGCFSLLVFGVISLTKSQAITPATAEQAAEAIEAQGYKAMDITEQWYKPGSQLLSGVGAKDDDVEILYFIFENDKKSLNIAQQFRSYIRDNRYYAENIEVENSMANFSIYTIRCNGEFTACARVGNTVFYAEANEENAETVLKIMDSIGYLYN